MLSAPSDDTDIYNGVVEGVTTLVGALGVFIVGFVKLDWTKYGEYGVVLVSVLEGGLLYWMSLTNEIWVAYISMCHFPE